MLRIGALFFTASVIAFSAKLHAQLPSPLFAMCEDTDGCSLWQFQGQQADANWQDGAIAHLSIVRFNSSSTGEVTIQRNDPSGVFAGLAATYAGTRNGNFVEGQVTWTLPGKPGGTTHWLGVFLQDALHTIPTPAEAAVTEPAYIKSCGIGVGCMSWNLLGSKIAFSSPTSAQARMTLEHIGQHTLVIRRKEVSGPMNGTETIYVAMVKNNSFDGLLVAKLPNKPQPVVERWHGEIPADAYASNASTVAAENTVPHSEFTGTLGMCEDTDGCSLWIFKNGRGTGHWANGAEAQLVIDRLDSTSIQLSRIDTSGSDLGLTARYEAERHGDWVEGSVSWDWRGHSPGKTAFRGAFQSFSDRTVEAAVAQIPKHVLACDAVEICYDWNLHGTSGYIRSEDEATTGRLTLQTFNESSVIVRAHFDTGSAGADVIWTGRRRGNIISGVSSWLWPGHGVNSAGTTTWRATIESVPTLTASGGSSLREPFNLLGLWLPANPSGSTKSKDLYEIGQYGNELHIRRPSPEDPSYRFTSFVSDQLNTRQIIGFSLAGGTWSSDQITVLDPDHIALKNGTVLSRQSMPKENDVPCNKENSAGVKAFYANLRARAAYSAKNVALAFCWVNIAAQQGEANGEFVAGLMLHDGIGTPQDLPQAFHWIVAAAAQNNTAAMNELAVLYDKGEGTPKNSAKAQQIRDAISRQQANALWDQALHGNSWQSEMVRAGVGMIIDSYLNSWKPNCWEDASRPGIAVCDTF